MWCTWCYSGLYSFVDAIRLREGLLNITEYCHNQPLGYVWSPIWNWWVSIGVLNTYFCIIICYGIMNFHFLTFFYWIYVKITENLSIILISTDIAFFFWSVINMYYIPLERGESFLQFDIKFTFEYVFIKDVLKVLKQF
jgi:hypothetical protein